MEATCKPCGQSWGGYLTAHCARCHRTFTGITAFDKHLHRRPSYCKNPKYAGLEDAGRQYECWGSPQERPDMENKQRETETAPSIGSTRSTVDMTAAMTVTVYTKPACVQCDAMKRAFAKREVTFEAIDITTDPVAADRSRAYGYKQAPVTVIQIDGVDVDHWAGYSPTKLDQHFPRN